VAKDFRFGVALWAPASRSKWQDAVRRADDYGYDVVQVPDHVGASAPFPALLAAAEVTKMRIGTYVLNAGFYKPALLARDVAALNQFTDGRLELGLGAGYVREEFEAAELPFPSAKNRIYYLAHLTAYLREHLPTVPILIAGSGDRLVTLAAQRADIIGLTGGRPDSTAPDPLAERIDFVRNAAGERFAELELNMVITAVPHDGGAIPDLSLTRSLTRKYGPTLSDEQLLALPTVLTGSPRDMADTLRRYREAYGLTYISVQQQHAESFSKVIAELR
jgi:probable F420-dependent oxidoreductase